MLSERESDNKDFMRGLEAGRAEARAEANAQLYMLVTKLIDALKEKKEQCRV